jgi:hypothetical protein
MNVPSPSATPVTPLSSPGTSRQFALARPTALSTSDPVGGDRIAAGAVTRPTTPVK